MLPSLLIIYKLLFRLQLNYEDVIDEQPNPSCYGAIVIQVVTELCIIEQVYFESDRNSAKMLRMSSDFYFFDNWSDFVFTNILETESYWVLSFIL